MTNPILTAKTMTEVEDYEDISRFRHYTKAVYTVRIDGFFLKKIFMNL